MQESNTGDTLFLNMGMAIRITAAVIPLVSGVFEYSPENMGRAEQDVRMADIGACWFRKADDAGATALILDS